MFSNRILPCIWLPDWFEDLCQISVSKQNSTGAVFLSNHKVQFKFLPFHKFFFRYHHFICSFNRQNKATRTCITVKHFRPKNQCLIVLPVRRKKMKLYSCDNRIMWANNILWLTILGGLLWDKNMWSIWTIFQEDPTEGGFHPLKRPGVEEWWSRKRKYGVKTSDPWSCLWDFMNIFG